MTGKKRGLAAMSKKKRMIVVNKGIASRRKKADLKTMKAIQDLKAGDNTVQKAFMGRTMESAIVGATKILDVVYTCPHYKKSIAGYICEQCHNEIVTECRRRQEASETSVRKTRTDLALAITLMSADQLVQFSNILRSDIARVKSLSEKEKLVIMDSLVKLGQLLKEI